MFANRCELVIAVFMFVFTILSNPIFALSPADKNWADLQKCGTTALDANEYWLAEPLLKKALIQAKEFRPTDMRLAKSIAELGRLYTIRGQFPRAATYLEAELRVKEILLAKKQYQCIPTMGSLIQFYFNYDMQDKAPPLTVRMLSLIDSRLKTTEGPMIEWANICDTIGDRYHSAHNFVLADKLFETALNIKTTLLPSNHLSLADSYEHMGNLNMEKNDVAKAEEYFTNALKITKKNLPPDSHEVYARIDELAKCLISQKKYDKAEKLYFDAENSCQSEYGKPDERISALFALGSLYTQEHKYKLAISYFQKAVGLAKQSNGSNSISLAPYLKKIDLVKAGQYQPSAKKASNVISQKSDHNNKPSMLAEKNLKNL